MQKVNPILNAIAFTIIGGLLFFALYIDKPESIEDEYVVIFDQHPNGDEIKESLSLSGYIGFEHFPFSRLDRPLSATNLYRSPNDFDQYAVFFEHHSDGTTTFGFIIAEDQCKEGAVLNDLLVNDTPFSFTGSCDDKRTDIQFITPIEPADNQRLLTIFENQSVVHLQPDTSSSFTVRFSMDGFSQMLNGNVAAE